MSRSISLLSFLQYFPHGRFCNILQWVVKQTVNNFFFLKTIPIRSFRTENDSQTKCGYIFTLEICIHKSSIFIALPDWCVPRARSTPSPRLPTNPLTNSAAAAFRICKANNDWNHKYRQKKENIIVLVLRVFVCTMEETH